MNGKVRQTGSLLRVTKKRELCYYSVTRKRWSYGNKSISLADICGLNSEERDRLLEFFRQERARAMSPRKKPLDKARKTR